MQEKNAKGINLFIIELSNLQQTQMIKTLIAILLRDFKLPLVSLMQIHPTLYKTFILNATYNNIKAERSFLF